MICESMQERIAVRLAGDLSAGGRDELARHLEQCASCAEYAASTERLWAELDDAAAPSERLRATFDEWLGRETRVVRLDRYRTFERWLPLAATLLLGIGVGYFAGEGERHEMTALRGEVEALHASVAESLLGQSSVSKRLRGVAYARDLPTVNPVVVDALLRALSDDESVNVRLAAVEALAPLIGDASRQNELVGAIAIQSSPMVQLSLIEALLESGDALVRAELERLVDDPRLDVTVRAYLRDQLMRSV